MKKLIITMFLSASPCFAQVAEPFGTECDPSQNIQLYETLVEWFNSNRYDVEEVRKTTVEKLRKSLTLERYQGEFLEGGYQYEMYRFNFPMGEVKVGVLLTVYASINGKIKCQTDVSSVAQYK